MNHPVVYRSTLIGVVIISENLHSIIIKQDYLIVIFVTGVIF